MTVSGQPAPDLARLLAVLWQGRGLILGVSVLMTLAGGGIALSTVPLYQAGSLLQLEERGAALAVPEAMQELLGGGARGVVLVETETEILRSRLVLGAAVRQLRLTQIARPRGAPFPGELQGMLLFPNHDGAGEVIRLAHLAVPADWLGQAIDLTHLGGGIYQLVLPDKTRLQGQVGQPLQAAPAGFELTVAELQGAAGRRFELREDPFALAVTRLQEALSVRPASRNALLLRLRYLHPDPQEAVRILDAIAAAYVAENTGRSAAEATRSLHFMEEQLPLAQEAVARAQQAMNAYQQAQKSVDVSYETRSLLEQATGLETRLNALILQEEELKKRFTPNHPTYQQLLETRATLSGQLDELRRITAALPETQQEIFKLNRDLEVATGVYTQMLNRTQALRVLRASTVGAQARVVDMAWSDGQRQYPKISLHLLFSAVIGLLLGALAVLLRQALRRGIRSEQEIEAMGLPVLAILPLAGEQRPGQSGALALRHPQSRATEGLRSLRTALHFSRELRGSPVLLITSASPGAGKSFTALNLAIVAAEAGQRVCLVDGDLRQGGLGQALGLAAGTPGLADYLAGTAVPASLALASAVAGLWVIPAGARAPNPSELLMRPDYEQLIAALGQAYDLVLIDSPSALAVSDPVLLARAGGSRLLLVRHAKTRRSEIAAVRRLFAGAGLPLTAAVLNGWRRSAAPAGQGDGAIFYAARDAPGPFADRRFGLSPDAPPDDRLTG